MNRPVLEAQQETGRMRTKEREDRALLAAKLKLEGLERREIAERLGVQPDSVAGLVRRGKRIEAAREAEAREFWEAIEPGRRP